MSRTVLVTGGAGFIGSNLARLLVARGDRVRILDDLSTGHEAYLSGVTHEFVRATIADGAAVERAIVGVDEVVHLAARASIPDSILDPRASFDANVAQTLALLDDARRAGIRKFVFASSNAATGDHEPPASETNLPHPISPYGASKLAVEAYCQAYAATYGIGACALRFANAYGLYSLHKTSVVAAWVRAAVTEQPILVNGDGEQTRDYVSAEDLARAVVAALDAPVERVAGEVFQIGTGRETSLNQLAIELGQVLGRELEIVHGPARAGDVRRNVSRVDKAAEVLGFRAQTDLDEGLAGTTQWFEAALRDPALAGVTAHAASGSE